MAPKIVDLARRSLARTRRRGVTESLALAVEEVVGLARHGRSTGGRVRHHELGHDDDHHEFQSVRFRIARRCLEVVPAAQRQGFLDLGCGRGRALQVAARMGFSPVIGVELAPGLAADARAAVGTAATIVEGDAGAYEIPADVNTVFLENPFGPITMAAVLGHLDRSQAESPRPIWIAYVNPGERGLLEAAGFAEVWSDVDTVVLRRPAVA